MRITKKSSALFVAAVAAASFVSGAAYAQQMGDDALSHMSSPRADGKCWVSTEKPVMENGYGYWGPCAGTTGSAAGTSAGQRARAQARGSRNNHE
ncbi:MAG TPA: hypothetical protein VGJ01_07080 [Pseudolabrys sp.]|jgi:hypothetical protein